jgi:3-oxoacyl-[acyl-carrier protein] reductase
MLMPLSKLSRSIRNQVALVTGAASGIGRATAHLLADEGAAVAVTDITQEGVDRVVQEIIDAGGKAKGWVLDIANAVQIMDVTNEVIAHYGGIDILINNAGISLFTKIDSDDYEDLWDRSLDVMLKGQVRLVRAALPALRQSKHPRIVNLASTEGLGATPYGSTYTTAKHGVIGLTRALAVELGPEGITVNCVCPGPTLTGMTQAIPDTDKVVFAKRRTALKRYAQPEEIAHAIVNLTLPASSYMTGVALAVDGGLTIRYA